MKDTDANRLAARAAFALVFAWSVIAIAALLPDGTALAQEQAHTVTVTVDGVRSDEGLVTGSLCDDPVTPLCSTYVARTRPAGGRAELRFVGVTAGLYALSTVHDEDGDGRTEIPPEGYAFGNNSATPVFEISSIRVEADVATAVLMTYPGSAPRMGSQGAPPPEGVVRIDVRDDGLYGELYVPDGAGGPLPAVILLDGSNGGLDGISAIAGPIALEGYAALALAYFAAGGAPLPFLRPDISLYDPNGPTTPLFVSALEAGAPAETEIAVERINGPILLIAGADDEVWPSSAMAERIVARLSRAGFAHEVENVVYSGGHYVLTGNPDALPRVLEFLGRGLGDGQSRTDR